MSKIICDVCGTRYPASAEQCPICGRVDPAAAKAEEKEVENAYGRSHSQTKGGHFSKSNVKKRTQGAPVIEEPEEPVKEEPVVTEEEVYEIEEKKKSGCLVNFLLVVVILALLAASAFIAVQYVMPEVIDRIIPQDTVATVVATEPSTEATTEPTTEATTEAPTIPCSNLVLLESIIMIDEVGQSYLLNAAVAPEDTTDTLMFVSADESIATVNADGRVTSVAPGNTVITVSCGEFSAECTVVSAPGEITVPTGADGEVETTAPTEGESDTESTTATTAPTTNTNLKNVTLTVKATDVTFVHRGQQATFKLTCGLKNNEVTWTSQNEDIITVDENGVATCTGYGTTNVIVSYGDQQVTILVRCTKK